MLVRTSDIGPNYRRVTVKHETFRDLGEVTPGAVVKVNGRYLAIAALRGEELDVVVGKTSFLDTEEVKDVELLAGTGFKDWDVPEAYLIAAGSGLGALLPIVEKRTDLGLETTLHFYGRNVKESTVLETLPVLRKVNFGCWDTVVWGRPRIPQEVLVLPMSHSIFFAGPRSFQTDLQAVSGGPKINLNF